MWPATRSLRASSSGLCAHISVVGRSTCVFLRNRAHVFTMRPASLAPCLHNLLSPVHPPRALVCIDNLRRHRPRVGRTFFLTVFPHGRRLLSHRSDSQTPPSAPVCHLQLSWIRVAVPASPSHVAAPSCMAPMTARGPVAQITILVLNPAHTAARPPVRWIPIPIMSPLPHTFRS
ncbi:hypothetical protein BD309DRAFT_499744 [Dichomitus squalens]|uniref:Uncharacterized protein n=1 Tax=Dichomitus squalens TaxID=114155 RepID=A0A4Q9QDJ8_9APHY|nr:hypothetical protein BD309DRAFT_499744 [Dichomitus squalens]TBU65420.1 hypothetical protein BD310DRAFT_7631 [Dichomitus squalens]